MHFFALCFTLILIHTKLFFANQLLNCFALNDNWPCNSLLQRNRPLWEVGKPQLLTSKLSNTIWMTLWAMRNWQPYYQTPIRNFFGFGNPGLPTRSHLSSTILFFRSSGPLSQIPGTTPLLSFSLCLFFILFPLFSPSFRLFIYCLTNMVIWLPGIGLVWTVLTCAFLIYDNRAYFRFNTLWFMLIYILITKNRAGNSKGPCCFFIGT